ncbi:MAG TPA: hypothetical protein VF552_12725 [Allosphingosinicella sp.]|jgi:hypothetical protein
MVRVIIGAIPAAIAMFLLGFVFYASGLQRMVTGGVEDVPAAAIQQTLARNLPATGTYVVPEPAEGAAQAVMYGTGPIATIHYNTRGYGATDTGSLITGLLLDFVVALLIGAALIGIDRRVPDFASRGRLVVFIAVACAAYINLLGPIFYHHGWAHFIYRFFADAVTLSVGGLIIARWFLSSPRAAPRDAPAEV